MWEKIIETLQSTQIVTLGMQDQVDLGQDMSEEIRDLEQSIAALIVREQNLIKMMNVEGIDNVLVESGLAPINAQRRAQKTDCNSYSISCQIGRSLQSQ